MEDQERPDSQFLEQLERRYAQELLRLTRRSATVSGRDIIVLGGEAPAPAVPAEIDSEAARPLGVPIGPGIDVRDIEARGDLAMAGRDLAMEAHAPRGVVRFFLLLTPIMAILVIIIGLFVLFTPSLGQVLQIVGIILGLTAIVAICLVVALYYSNVSYHRSLHGRDLQNARDAKSETAGKRMSDSTDNTNRIAAVQPRSHSVVPLQSDTAEIKEPGKEIEQIRALIADLQVALEAVKLAQQHLPTAPLGTAPSTELYASAAPFRPATSLVPATEDCDHWRQLLNTHTRVVRALELQAAEQGSDFHYSKKIELEERKERVVELQHRIAVNC